MAAALALALSLVHFLNLELRWACFVYVLVHHQWEAFLQSFLIPLIPAHWSHLDHLVYGCHASLALAHWDRYHEVLLRVLWHFVSSCALDQILKCFDIVQQRRILLYHIVGRQLDCLGLELLNWLHHDLVAILTIRQYILISCMVQNILKCIFCHL